MPTPGEIAADRCPTDVQEYGQRNGLPEFARATWQAGFIDGYRYATRPAIRGQASAPPQTDGSNAGERDDWLWSEHGPTPALDESDGVLDEAPEETGSDAVERAMDVAEFNRKTSINKRVADRYNELMREGKHGTYETLFRIVHEERRDSHRDGAEAMRADCAMALSAGANTPDAIRALPIPGSKT